MVFPPITPATSTSAPEPSTTPPFQPISRITPLAVQQTAVLPYFTMHTTCFTAHTTLTSCTIDVPSPVPVPPPLFATAPLFPSSSAATAPCPCPCQYSSPWLHHIWHNLPPLRFSLPCLCHHLLHQHTYFHPAHRPSPACASNHGSIRPSAITPGPALASSAAHGSTTFGSIFHPCGSAYRVCATICCTSTPTSILPTAPPLLVLATMVPSGPPPLPPARPCCSHV